MKATWGYNKYLKKFELQTNTWEFPFLKAILPFSYFCYIIYLIIGIILFSYTCKSIKDKFRFLILSENRKNY